MSENRKLTTSNNLQSRQRQAGANFMAAFNALKRDGLSTKQAMRQAQEWAWKSTGLTSTEFPVVSMAEDIYKKP